MRGHERISAKLAKFQPSLTLQGLVAARRAQGLPECDFGLGEAKGVLDPSIRDAGERTFRERGHDVLGAPAGTRERREAVLRWLDVDDRYGPGSVVISTSGSLNPELALLIRNRESSQAVEKLSQLDV